MLKLTHKFPRRICLWSIVVVLGASGCSTPKSLTVETHAAAGSGEAVLALQQTEPAAAEPAEKLVGTGKRQYERGLLDSAHRTLEKAVQADPNNKKAWYYLYRVKESLHERDWKEQKRRDLLDKMNIPPDLTGPGGGTGAPPDGGPAEWRVSLS